tara:strand:- start:250 stop:429 length:180 start_codon:yes stop_codon:yes gene_type:complete
MVISNQIFESFRIKERVKEQKKAVKILISQGYTLLDPEGNILNKQNTRFDIDNNKVQPE